MIADLINHPKPAGATESTVFGPFHRDGAPALPAGGVTTHVFDSVDPYLESDAVVAVKKKKDVRS